MEEISLVENYTVHIQLGGAITASSSSSSSSTASFSLKARDTGSLLALTSKNYTPGRPKGLELTLVETSNYSTIENQPTELPLSIFITETPIKSSAGRSKSPLSSKDIKYECLTKVEVKSIRNASLGNYFHKFGSGKHSYVNSGHEKILGSSMRKELQLRNINQTQAIINEEEDKDTQQVEACLTISFDINATSYSESTSTSSSSSQDSNFRSHKLLYKLNDDIRQDEFITQIIKNIDSILKYSDLELFIVNYKALVDYLFYTSHTHTHTQTHRIYLL